MNSRLPLLFAVTLLSMLATRPAMADPVKYCRFEVEGRVAYGIVEGEAVTELSGDIFGEWERTRRTHSLEEVSLLVPTQPQHIFAMAGNYESHLGNENSVTTIITSETKVITNLDTGETTTEEKSTTELRRSGEVPERFSIPQPFFKSPGSLTAHETSIVLPDGAEEVHFEAEMVVVIGREAENVAEEDALDYVFGVTCGNDVSARVWQDNDVQWWRAKASDTFGPCGPFVVSGLDYDDLLMTLRLNGEVKQQERTSHLIHDVSATVSFISQHVTLQPGDLIFTGTPGQTSALSPGDVVEVELEGVGVLRNGVVADR